MDLLELLTRYNSKTAAFSISTLHAVTLQSTGRNYYSIIHKCASVFREY
jgi:hypothetical protein